MLGTAAAILLCLLPSQVNGLTAQAICQTGNEWTYSSIGQSPCDIALELLQVCYSQTVQVPPLIGTISAYPGPSLGSDTSCSCSSVYYSLLSACAYCQGGSVTPWSTYSYNCTRVNLAVYPYPIPVGVRVPAYAYQDVSIGDRFNVSLAYRVSPGIESTRPPSSTQLSTSASSSSAPASSSSSVPSTTTVIAKTSVSPGTVGGVVVGGLVGIGLVAALITFLVLRSRQKSRSQASPDMEFNPDTATSLNHFSKVYDPNDPSDMDDPNNLLYSTPLFTGNGSSQNNATPQLTQQNTGGRYSGMPEL